MDNAIRSNFFAFAEAELELAFIVEAPARV